MNFENLDVWKRSARLSVDIYRFTADIKDYGFRDQLSRFIDIARASLAEARTQIYIGTEIGYLNKSTSQQWITETNELAAMLTSLKNKFDNS